MTDSDRIFTLIRQALIDAHKAGFAQGRYVHAYTVDNDELEARNARAATLAEHTAGASQIDMWGALYDAIGRIDG